MNKIKAWYAGLQAREQRVVLIGAVAVGLLILVGGILWPLHSAVAKAVKRSEIRKEDLAWMRLNASEVLAGSATLAPPTGEPPVALVDRVGREAGLASALKGTQPSGGVPSRCRRSPCPRKGPRRPRSCRKKWARRECCGLS